MPTRWRDTMAVCAYRALPLGLDDVGQVLNLDVKKDKRGKYLLQQLSKPRKPLKAEKKAFEEQGLTPDQFPILWREDWNLLEELYEYCLTDVDSEKSLAHAIGYLPPAEQRIWVMDQIINRRGVQVDLDLVYAAKDLADRITAQYTEELVTLTSGAVQTHGQRDKILSWIEEQGAWIPDLRADTVKDYVKNADVYKLPDNVKRILEIRQLLAKSSLSKLDKILEWVCEDGKLRGLLQYHGAGTGRWAGRGPQPQNFVRGLLEDYAGKDLDQAEVMELLVETIKSRDLEALELLFGNPMEALATALRGVFIPSPGHEMFVGDFSAIEAIVAAWVAGEDWKVAAFEAIHRGEGYEGSAHIYCATASKVFGYPVIDKKAHPKERQVGKTCELAFTYQGGVGAWRNFDSSDKYTDPEVDQFKIDWRAKHPATESLWYGLENAAVNAVELDRPCSYGPITYEVVRDNAGKWLTCILPNGRRLWYYNPQLEEIVVTYSNGKKRLKKQLTYEGKDDKRGGAWGIIYAYGGLLTENVVQAISRDIMVEAMIRLMKLGYHIILTVHDEIVAERKIGEGFVKEFMEALKGPISRWLYGCPINAEGWKGFRYRK
jgi:DNA polymerase bacteriophage-type